MADNYKPGGGNKMQPYVPAGHGDKSGEYTNKSYSKYKPPLNIAGEYNYAKSRLVKRVDHIWVAKSFEEKVPTHFIANSVFKKLDNNRVISERYYNEYGDVYLDIDYTDHKNPGTHPIVPHMHRWEKSLDGKLHHGHWEKVRWKEKN